MACLDNFALVGVYFFFSTDSFTSYSATFMMIESLYNLRQIFSTVIVYLFMLSLEIYLALIFKPNFDLQTIFLFKC